MSRRLATVLVAVFALLACTPTTGAAMPTDPHKPPATSREARLARPAMTPLQPAVTPVGVTMTTAPTYLTGTQHAAFPDLEPMTGGGLELVYREASNHYLARDGALLSTTLDAVGAAPMPPVTLLAAAGIDYRDPSLTVVGGNRYLTYFTGSGANPAEGAYVTVNGGPPVRVDNMAPYAAIAAPVVKLGDGRLAAPWYGRQLGETLDKAYLATSVDGGATWTSNRILNPGAVGTPEPWIVVDGNRVLFFARWGATGLALRISLDNGQSWGAPKLISETVQMTGRPTVYRTSAGVLVMVYRTLPAKDARIAYSLDGGTIWKIGGLVMAAPAGSPNGMTYAAMHEILPGVIRTIVGMELSDGSSALYSTTLAVSVQ